jgi:transcription elongation factor Elf1
MRIFRCPRCRAEDISADAHPTRVLDNGTERVVLVCRNCYRAAELEFRIASQTEDLGYVPMAIRDSLFALRDFYRARLAEYDDPNVLLDDSERVDATRAIRTALESVERRLAIAPTS